MEREVRELLGDAFDAAVVERVSDGRQLLRVGKVDGARYRRLYSYHFGGGVPIDPRRLRSLATVSQGSATCFYRAIAGLYVGLFGQVSRDEPWAKQDEAKATGAALAKLVQGSPLRKLPVLAPPARRPRLRAARLGPDLAGLDLFLREVEAYPWLRSAGRRCAGAQVAKSLSHGHEGGPWAEASERLWSRTSRQLERRARRKRTDAWIGAVFENVAAVVGPAAWTGLGDYLERGQRRSRSFDPDGLQSAVALEALEAVKRDVAWAAVERLLGVDGFFTGLLGWYAQGRWPCGWRGGSPPRGQVVVV